MTTAPASGTPAAPAPSGEPILKVDEIHSLLRLDRGAQGHLARGLSRRDRHADRLQRRRASRRRCARSPGSCRRSEGKIVFEGREIQEMTGHEVAEIGIAQSPEGRRIFPRMTVRENLEMGAFTRKDDEIEQDIEHVYELFPRLREREKQKGGTMSGGEQQMLAMGRALMARPRLLLLDEPSLGLAPVIVDKIYEIVREINAAGHHDPARRAERELRARRLLARLRARDRHGRAHRQLGEPPQRPARPGRVPRNMTTRPRSGRHQGALAALHLADLRDRLPVARRAEGLQREGRSRNRPAVSASSGVPIWLLIRAKPNSRWANRRERKRAASGAASAGD